VGQAMAYVSSAMSMGLILGPVLGGLLYDRRGYYAAFALAFALIGFDLVLRIILVEKKIAVRYNAAPSTVAGETGQSVKLTQLSRLERTQESTEQTPSTPLPVLTVRKSRIPPVIRILKYPRLLVALFLSFVQALILSAFDATLPLYLNSLFGFTALESGASRSS
jgi:MFS family permease